MLRAILIFLALFPFAAAQAQMPGLVHVKVEVFDEGFGKMAPREGTGTLVKWKDRFFVLTAAHVTVLADAELSCEGEKLVTLQKLTDGASDVEWIEVKPPSQAKPKVVWSDELKDFVLEPSLSPNFIDDTVTVTSKDCSFAVGASGKHCTSVFFIPPAIVPLMKSLERPEIYVSGSDSLKSSLASASLEANTGRIVLPRSIRHGESGSPIFMEETKRSSTKVFWRLVGVSQSFDINFPFSYYGTNILNPFRRLVSQRVAPKSEGAFWRLRYGMTYLDFGNGIKEIALARGQAGSSGLTDDGGSSGLTDDGASGSGGAPSEDVFEARKLVPGIEVDQKACVGFRAKRAGAYFADRALIQGLISGSVPRGNCVAQGEKLQPLLVDRLNRLAKKKLGPLVMFGKKDQAHIIFREAGVTVHLPVSGQDGSRKGWLWFDLDEKGGYQSRAFRPVVRVQGPGGKTYVVDLRGLYFSQLTSGTGNDFSDANKQSIMVQARATDGQLGDNPVNQYVFDDPKNIFVPGSPDYQP